MNDLSLAIAVGVVLTLGALLVAKKFAVSFLPFITVGPILIAVGIAAQIPSSPIYVGLQDGYGYQQWGYAISEGWRSGVKWELQDFWPGKGIWPLLISGFSLLAGPVFISLIVFNSLLTAFSVVMLQKATSLAFGVKPRLLFILLTLSSSPILVNGPSLLREAIFWLGISTGVTALAYLHRRRYTTAVALLLTAIFLILAIRPNYGVVIGYLLVFAAVGMWISQKRSGNWKQLAIGSGLALVLAFSFPPVFSYLSVDIENLDYRLSRIATEHMAEDVTTSMAVSPAGNETASNQLLSPTFQAVILRLPHAALGPFLWEVGPEPIWSVVIASTLHYWFLITTSLLLLLRRGNRNPFTFALFLASAITVASLAVPMTNYGILVRFRVVAEILLTPLSIAYLARWRT